MSRWRLQPLYSVATEVRETVEPAVFGEDEVEHYSIPALDATGWPEVVPASEILSGKQRLRGGEVMVSRLNPRKARVLEVPPLGQRVALASGEFVVMRPSAIDSRFLTYVLLAESTRQVLDSMVQSVTRSHQRIRPEHLMKLSVPTPAGAQQRAIANYLDTETARIDALIAKKRHLIEALEQRRWLVLADLISSMDAPPVPLRRAIGTITDGPFGSAFSSSEYSVRGVVVVRLGNIGFAEWRGRDLAYLPEERFAEFYRHRIREGDLLIAGLGDANNHAGRACVAPDLGKAIVKGKCFCARVNRRTAVPEYLAMFCSSPLGAEAVSLEARGSTRLMINLDIMKAIPVPLPPVAVQKAIVDQVHRAWSTTARAVDSLRRQVDLLTERRQALITAAVTGELVVPGAA